MRNSRSRKLIRLTLGEAIQPTGPGMPEGHQDQQPVANRVAAVAGSGEQALDLAFRQVLALRSTASYCRRALVASYRACSSANSI